MSGLWLLRPSSAGESAAGGGAAASSAIVIDSDNDEAGDDNTAAGLQEKVDQGRAELERHLRLQGKSARVERRVVVAFVVVAHAKTCSCETAWLWCFICFGGRQF